MFTLYFGSPVILERSLNSICMVVTSEVLLSGPHLGAWALPVRKFTSENGTREGELKHGNSLFPRSVCKRHLTLLYLVMTKFSLFSSQVIYALCIYLIKEVYINLHSQYFPLLLATYS